MRSIVSPNFKKMLEKLPPDVQEEAKSNFLKWKQDPSLVGWKKLAGMKANLFSVEIGRRYRAIAIVEKEHDAAVWMFVGSHETYNNWLNIHRQMTQENWTKGFKDRLFIQRQQNTPSNSLKNSVVKRNQFS